MSHGPVTVGIDIGSTSVKAVAVDTHGQVVDRCRLPHKLLTPEPDLLEHDAVAAWWRGPRRALRRLSQHEPRAVAVASMTPSLTAVDRRGRPLAPGLLYGDARGRGEGGEATGFAQWLVEAAPRATGYWPAPAVANVALGAEAVVDIGTAFTSTPEGVPPECVPRFEGFGTAIGTARGSDTVVATGAVDGYCEQLVGGADEPGDAHVAFGTTLLVWAILAEPREVPGLWTHPHARAGRWAVGGASNAGGLFLDWVARLLGKVRSPATDPDRVPVWVPYVRGERTPLHDPDRRAALHGLDLTHGPAELQRAAWEASGFVVRHHLELAGVTPTRVVATGGGTRAGGWMQAVADCTGAPVHVAAAPDGAAIGAAFLAGLAVGLHDDVAAASSWARTGTVVEPDPRWAAAADARYHRFREITA